MGTATDQNIGMTVFELQSFESWQNRVETAAQSIGAGITRKGAACQLWMPNQLLPVRKTNLHYADGVKIVREWLGPRRNALAIIPHRVYFEPGANTPSIKPERVLIEGARPALPSPDKRISHVWNGPGFYQNILTDLILNLSRPNEFGMIYTNQRN